MFKKLCTFVKKEAVLCISALLALLTVVIVPPDTEYLHYIDFRVLCLLMCLMAVVAGLRNIGVFSWLTYRLLKKIKSGKILGITLVLLPFFSSMLVTNDVALIVFIPFTITLLSNLNLKKYTVPIIVLQTVAANLGSMATPIGNPQNLFLYSAYELSAADFFSITLPLTAVSFFALLVASFFSLPAELHTESYKKEIISNKIKLLVFFALFSLSLLTVFRVVPYQLTTIITVIVFLAYDRKSFKEIDFILLLTFVCFFIISENLGRVEAVRSFLQELLEKNTLLTSVGASQIISNVPAAVLLSGFTDKWRDILAGVNIGGLGTPIASLASLITLKLYTKSDNAKTGVFLLVFSAVNLSLLIILLASAFLL